MFCNRPFIGLQRGSLRRKNLDSCDFGMGKKLKAKTFTAKALGTQRVETLNNKKFLLFFALFAPWR
jgi:hypothetical protein